MTSTVRLLRVSLVLMLAAGTLAACGGESKTETTKKRGSMPFVGLKLKNTSPVGGHPATAQATGATAARPSAPLTAGPVPPGGEGSNPSPGTDSADSVSIVVTFTGGPTFRGAGSYPGFFIGSVDVECGEPGGGVARVNFASGQPAQSIPLAP
jgi:hypothetical protein